MLAGTSYSNDVCTSRSPPPRRAPSSVACVMTMFTLSDVN